MMLTTIVLFSVDCGKLTCFPAATLESIFRWRQAPRKVSLQAHEFFKAADGPADFGCAPLGWEAPILGIESGSLTQATEE